MSLRRLHLNSNIHRFLTNNSLLESNSVGEIFVDSKDKVWIGTYSGGLYTIDDDDNWMVYTDTIKSDNSFEAITELPNGEIWAKKWGGDFAVFIPKN